MSIKLYKTCITIVDCSTTFYHWLTKYLKIILNRHKLPEKPSRSFVLYCQSKTWTKPHVIQKQYQARVGLMARLQPFCGVRATTHMKR
jgi:hypothetical protein